MSGMGILGRAELGVLRMFLMKSLLSSELNDVL
jgi:hypothetical protein